MIIAVVAIVALSGFLYAIFFGAPYLPMRAEDVAQIINELDIKKGKTFYDLGSGDGKLLVAAAQKGAKVVGYEINPVLWLISALRVRKYGGRVKFASFWRADLAKADYVSVFLVGHFMAKLERKVKAEMQPASTMISYVFDLPKLKPNRKTRNLYIYDF